MRELLFADDSTLVTHSAEEMQKIVDVFSKASTKFGLKINIKKTEMLYQPNSTRTSVFLMLIVMPNFFDASEKESTIFCITSAEWAISALSYTNSIFPSVSE